MAADMLAILVGATLAGSAAIVLVLAGRKLVRRLFGPVATYAAWLIVPAAVAASLLPARSPEVLPLQPAPLRPAAETAARAAADWVVANAPVVANAAPVNASAFVLSAWLIGALACAGLFFVVQRRTVRRFGELVEDTSGGLAVLRAATNDAGPAVIGVLRPRLVIPYDFERRFSPGEQVLILAHERAHMAFRDPMVNGLIALLRCLNWFNPIVHLGAVMARVDQELACDAAVVASHPGERRAYAEALLKSQLAPASLPLGCYWPVRSPRLLKERVEMLAIERPGLVRRLMGSAAIVAVALTAGYAAWAAEPHQQVAALSTRPAVTATTPAPRPTMTVVSYVLPPPTAAQYAALNASAPGGSRPVLMDRSTGAAVQMLPGGVDVATSQLYGMQGLNNPSQPRGSVLPDRYLLDDVQSLWLADGRVAPSMDPRDVVSGLTASFAGLNGAVGGYATYRVDGEQVTVDQVMIIEGKAVAMRGLQVPLGQTSVVELAGGHVLSLSPRLRRMTDEEWRSVEDDLD